MDQTRAEFADAWRGLDPQMADILDTLYTKGRGQPTLSEMTAAQAREAAKGLAFYFSAGAPAVPSIAQRIIDAASGPIRLRLYDPGCAAPAPTVLFLHGGGWVQCDIDIYDGVARQLTHRSELRILSVDYGLAPEHPFPIPVEDCVAAVRWAAREGAELGIDPKRLAIAGDSAGGNLALATCIALRDAGESPLQGAALIYGVYSADFATPSQRAYGGGAYLVSTADIKWYWDQYVPDPTRRSAPLASPIHADLRGLPPVYIATAEFGLLRSDSEAIQAKLEDTGAPVEFRLWPGMIHASMNFTGWIDAMGPEVDRIGEFLRRVTANPRT
jgi:acetyl esterase